MIVVYTGDGKGKTSACVGQAIRAYGQGLRVAFGQFMKREDRAGEQKVLKDLLGKNFLASGLGFFRKTEDFPAHRQAALTLVDWAEQCLDRVDIIILDEALYALSRSLIEPGEFLSFIKKAENSGVHLVFSGRGVPGWLAELADIVTEMAELKHCLREGSTAERGIEF